MAAENGILKGDAWPDVVEQGIKKIMIYGGATVGMKTLLDAVVPFSDALKMGEGLKAAAAAARAGAESTKGLSISSQLTDFTHPLGNITANPF